LWTLVKIFQKAKINKYKHKLIYFYIELASKLASKFKREEQSGNAIESNITSFKNII